MLKIEFETGNSAFEDEGAIEISNILDDIKHLIWSDYGQISIGQTIGAAIYDWNGNNIGEWNFTREV